MIIFRPSIGNNVSVVSVDTRANWYGKSLGGKLVKEVQTPTTPFTKVDSKLYSTVDLAPGQQSSTWFYKDVTDFDFINGQAIYRCMYIGVEPDVPGDVDFSEIIGTLTSVATHTVPTTYPSTQTQAEADAYLDNTVTLEMWYENTYNILSSENTLSIDDEFDSTRKLEDAISASGDLWQTVLPLNLTLVPGQYVKIWIKITPTFDRSLLDYGGYTYTYSIGDLVIQNINKVTGRLNVAKVYNGILDDAVGNILVNQVLPIQFEYNEVLKIIEKDGFTNVFYLDLENKMKDLIIKQNIDVNENKYIDYDFSVLTGSITGDNSYSFARVIDCLNGGNTQSLNVVNNALRPYLNRKTIVDVFLSKSERQDAFIFFNELVNNESTDYEEKYNHTLYSWNFGVIRLNLNFTNDNQFDEIEAGLENAFDLEILDTSEIYILKPNHFATSVIQQDDLYTSLGFDIEDCRVNEKKSFLTYIWEKDIVKPRVESVDGEEVKYVKTYSSLLPKDVNNQVTTIKNRASTDAYLTFNNISGVDVENTKATREVVELNDDIQYLKMGSCHEKTVNIGTTSVAFDIVNSLDEFSTTVGLSFEKSSLDSDTPIENSDTITYSIEYPSHNHLLYQEDFNDYNVPDLVYQDVIRTYFEEVVTRNDGLLSTLIQTSTDVVPLTGSSSEIVPIYLNKLLPDDSVQSYTENFGHIVKISGDGNTALVIPRNLIEVDDEGNPLYTFESSRVYVYKRCSGVWKRAIEITPTETSYGKFFSISDENRVDISGDGNRVIISAEASTRIVPVFGQQYDYDGYVVYYFETTDGWSSYDQTRIDTDVAMNAEQREFLTNDLSFGYSVSIASSGDKIAIGSPSEFFDYVETDENDAILNEYQVRNNGAVYVFTTTPTTPSGPAASGQNLEYGMTITGAETFYFLQRIIPNDSYDITVNGVPQECITDGVYQGKRFGEKVRLSSDGSKMAIGARYDNQKGLHAGAAYAISMPTDDCVPTVANMFIKVLPEVGYEDQEFTDYSLEISADGGTIVVGDANYNAHEGRAHVFDLDWFGMFTNPYVEVILPPGSFDDTTFVSVPREFGQSVAASTDGSTIYVKDSYSVRSYVSTGVRGNTARTFDYYLKVIVFDKVEKTDAITSESGQNLDVSNAGDVFILACAKNSVETEDRVFIQDYNPDAHIAITSETCGVTGGPDGIPVPYLIDIEHVPQEYTESEIIGEIDPQTIIGAEKLEFVYEDVFKVIGIINCNGNENITALSIEYNFYSKTWRLSGFNNEGSSVVSTIAPNIELSPYFPNAITINTFRKQVDGYSCGRRFMLTYDIYVNGLYLYSGETFTFDTTNSYVLTINPSADFSGSLTYWDVRNYLVNPLEYNKIMFGVISNKIWAELEPEFANTVESANGFESFIYRRNLLLHQIDWNTEDDVVIPIVLQGNGYSVGATYSENITRSKFDFSTIDINAPSFGFTYEGSNDVLRWKAEKYDYNKDQLIVWVRLENWKGQRLVMYYGDTSFIKPVPTERLYDGFYGVWLMDEFETISRLRYTDVRIFNGGEALVLGRNELYFLNQINKQYMFGNESIYKSNKFDIYYDDIDVVIDREESVADFIKTNVKLFAPGFMEIRNVSSSNPADIESNQSE